MLDLLDELLCGVLSPGFGADGVWLIDMVAPLPVFLGFVSDPSSSVVPLLVLVAVEQVPKCLIPLPGSDY